MFTWKIYVFCYLAATQPTLDHCKRDSLTYLMITTKFVKFQPKGYRAERLVGFELICAHSNSYHNALTH